MDTSSDENLFWRVVTNASKQTNACFPMKVLSIEAKGMLEYEEDGSMPEVLVLTHFRLSSHP